MSLLRQIENDGANKKLLRRLLETLHEAGELQSRLDALVEAEALALSATDRQQLAESPVDYLLNARPQPAAPRPPRPETMSTGRSPAFNDLMQRLLNKIESALLHDDHFIHDPQSDRNRQRIEEWFNQFLAEENLLLSRAERQRLFDAVAAELIGFGPLEPLLVDEQISDILVLGPKTIWITRQGKREQAAIRFNDEEHVLRILDRIALGRRIDETQPMLTLRTPDGSYVSAIVRPVSLTGPAIRILKTQRRPLQADDLLRLGMLTPEALAFLQACVQAGANVLIAGPAGAGKTTLLNLLAAALPETGLIVTIEDTSELQPQQPEVLALQTRPPNIEGRGEVRKSQLLQHALQMRPEHILIGELNGGEAYDLLRSPTHWMTTLNSGVTVDPLGRLETLSLLWAGKQTPPVAVRRQIASALHIVVVVDVLRDGRRRVASIAEVSDIEGERIILKEIFRFEPGALQAPKTAGEPAGELRPAGYRPQIAERIARWGIALPADLFGAPPTPRRRAKGQTRPASDET